MTEIIDIMTNWAIPTLLTGILAFITRIYQKNSNLINKINNDNNSVKDSLRLLLRSQIVGKCEQWLEVGYLPDSVRSCLEDMFEEYTKLGGNHGVNALVNQCFELPPKGGIKK